MGHQLAGGNKSSWCPKLCTHLEFNRAEHSGLNFSARGDSSSEHLFSNTCARRADLNTCARVCCSSCRSCREDPPPRPPDGRRRVARAAGCSRCVPSARRHTPLSNVAFHRPIPPTKTNMSMGNSWSRQRCFQLCTAPGGENDCGGWWRQVLQSSDSSQSDNDVSAAGTAASGGGSRGGGGRRPAAGGAGSSGGAARRTAGGAAGRGGGAQELIRQSRQQKQKESAWSRTPIRDTSCWCHPLTGVPCLRPGPRRRWKAGVQRAAVKLACAVASSCWAQP